MIKQIEVLAIVLVTVVALCIDGIVNREREFGDPVDEAALAATTGMNGSYEELTGGAYCSGLNVGEEQWPSYDCAGNLGAECILCRAIFDGKSGLAGGPGGIEPTGQDQTCTNHDKWIGECKRNPQTFKYYCDPGMNTGNKCVGDYPSFVNQLEP